MTPYTSMTNQQTRDEVEKGKEFTVFCSGTTEEQPTLYLTLLFEYVSESVWDFLFQDTACLLHMAALWKSPKL